MTENRTLSGNPEFTLAFLWVWAVPLFVVFYAIYFILVGALWLRWLWGWAGRELFPRAVEEGLVARELSFGTGVRITLLIAALYLLIVLPSILASLVNLILELQRY